MDEMISSAANKAPTRRRLRSLVVAAIAFGLLGAGAVVASGYRLSAPVPRSVGVPPADIKADNVEFPSDSGSVIHGWIVRGVPGRGVVILMHGVHSDRRSQIGRMRLLSHAGYTVLAFDFQSHGESPGRHITFGHLEALDAVAAVNYSRRSFPGERIGVIGESLGGAAVLLTP